MGEHEREMLELPHGPHDALIPPASLLREQLRRPRAPGEQTARSASEILARVKTRVMDHLAAGGCWNGADGGAPERACFICIEVATITALYGVPGGSSSPLRPTPGS